MILRHYLRLVFPLLYHVAATMRIDKKGPSNYEGKWLLKKKNSLRGPGILGSGLDELGIWNDVHSVVLGVCDAGAALEGRNGFRPGRLRQCARNERVGRRRNEPPVRIITNPPHKEFPPSTSRLTNEIRLISVSSVVPLPHHKDPPVVGGRLIKVTPAPVLNLAVTSIVTPAPASEPEKRKRFRFIMGHRRRPGYSLRTSSHLSEKQNHQPDRSGLGLLATLAISSAFSPSSHNQEPRSTDHEGRIT